VTPTQQLLADVGRTQTLRDRLGRSIVVRRPTALDTLRLLKAAGPALAQNQPWLSMAMLAMAVTEIDQLPVPSPISEAQIEAIVERLGEAGLDAIAAALDDPEADASTEPGTDVGNSLGTLS
jgi:hypothetical protein